MLRLILGSNGRLLNSIVAKWTMKMLRKYGMNSDVKCNDFTVFRDGEDVILHINGDVKIKESELMELIDKFM